MKFYNLLTVSFCLCFFFSSEAQITQGGKSYLDISANPRSDSVDVLAFKQLLIFISSKSVSGRKSDINLDSMKKVSESHFLYYNVPANPGQYQQDNSSYDNF